MMIPVHITARVILLPAILALWKTRGFRREGTIPHVPHNIHKIRNMSHSRPSEITRTYAGKLIFASQKGQTDTCER